MRKNIDKKPSIILIITLVGFPQISETIFTPSLPQISEAYYVSMSTAQLTLSIYFLSFALGVFSWGWFSDKIGRRLAMNLGIAVYGIGSLLCLLSGTMATLLLARFIQAFGASAGSIITQTILRESFDDDKRHQLFAQISAVLALTPAIGPFIGGVVGQWWGFRAVFLVLVLMSIGIFCFSYISLPETSVSTSKKMVSIKSMGRQLLTNPKVLIYGFLIGSLNGILFSYYAEAPFVFIERFGMSQSMYGLLGIVIALATVIGSVLSTYLLTFYIPERIIRIGLVISLSGSIGLLLVSTFISQATFMNILMYMFCVFVLLLGVGVSLPNCLSLSLVDFKKEIGTAGAIFSFGYYLLVSTVTYGMSQLHNGSLLTMPIYFILILSLGCLLARRLSKE